MILFKLLSLIRITFSNNYLIFTGEGHPLSSYAAHTLCAGKSNDGNWYRCRIEDAPSASPDTVHVRYIDYGNCEHIPTSLIRTLTPQFFAPSCLALKVFVALEPTAPVATVLAQITKLTEVFVLELSVVEYFEGNWIVEIGSNGHKLVDVLAEQKMVKRTPLDEVRAQIRAAKMQPAIMPVAAVTPIVAEAPAAAAPTPTPPAIVVPPPVVAPTPEPPAQPVFENRIAGCMSHADRPDRFYIRLQQEESHLANMNENIQIVAPALPDLEDFTVGNQCIVNYSADEAWYRAVIIDSDPGITSVQFIDYGNTDTITTTGLIKSMNAAFANIKPFAIPCALPLTPKGAADWSDTTCELMRSFCDLPVTFEYLSTGDKCNLVRLWLPPDNRDIMAELVRDGHAAIVPFISSGQSAFVSHINNLDDFYIQMQPDTGSLEIVSDYLGNIDQFPPVTDVTPNKICTAKFVDDDGWYRAKILDHSEDGTEILFIDYGNTSTSTELRELPQTIADMPPLSKQCALQMPAGVQLWSDEAEARFHEVSNQGATVFTVQLVQPSNRSSLVRLTYDGHDLSDELAALCNRFNPSDMDVSAQMTASMLGGQPAASKTVDPVVVGGVLFRVNTAGDFYVLPDAQKATSAAIAEELLRAATFPAVQVTQVGDMCVARPVGEERYLRARVLSINSDGK